MATVTPVLAFAMPLTTGKEYRYRIKGVTPSGEHVDFLAPKDFKFDFKLGVIGQMGSQSSPHNAYTKPTVNVPTFNVTHSGNRVSAVEHTGFKAIPTTSALRSYFTHYIPGCRVVEGIVHEPSAFGVTGSGNVRRKAILIQSDGSPLTIKGTPNSQINYALNNIGYSKPRAIVALNEKDEIQGLVFVHPGSTN